MCVVFPSWATFVKEVLPAMVRKTMQLHVLSGLLRQQHYQLILIFRCLEVAWTPLPY
jgi:hypothetical protein